MAAERLSTEDRRAQITDAALALIAERGIASLTTSAVADAVGLTTGALFRHFASLDEVLDSVGARVLELLRGTYPPPGLPALERLARFFDARTTLARSHPGIPRLVLSEQFSHALPEAARRSLREALRETRAFVESAIREAQREGEARDDVAPEALAVIVIGAMQMLVLHAELRSRGAVSARSLREALLRVVGVPPGTEAHRSGAEVESRRKKVVR